MPPFLQQVDDVARGFARRVGQRDVADQPCPGAPPAPSSRRSRARAAAVCRRRRRRHRGRKQPLTADEHRLAVHVALAPCPGTALNEVTAGALRPRPWPAGRSRGRSDARCAGSPPPPVAARRSAGTPSSGTTSVTTGVPCVSVPVLSNARLRTAASRSRCAPPLMSTPRRAPAASADTTATGVAMTSAHGQAITSSTSAR